VPSFPLACLAYLFIALPSSSLGLLWPSMRSSFHEPIGALGILLVIGITASVVSSAAAGRLLPRAGTGPVVAAGAGLPAVALAVEAAAPSVWVFATGMVLFGLGTGAADSALNAHAASHFGARQVNWMHASYGLGATIGPLLVTALLGDGFGWRWTYGTMAVIQGGLACVLILAGRSWDRGPGPADVARKPAGGRSGDGSQTRPAELGRASAEADGAGVPKGAGAVVIGSAFAAVEMGIESGAGIWGYVFLTAGRGLSPAAAGVAISAYWATMFAGRVIFGPVAERLGPGRVLAGAVIGVAGGAALMAVPGPGPLAVAGLAVLGLAAAPIFPLLTLTTPDRMAGGLAGTTRTVSLQVAASALGGAIFPAGLGLVAGAFRAGAVAPALLALSVVMFGLYGLLVRAGPGH
jgi:fucose permease